MIAFARAPAAGRAKTRLIPALGPEGAAQLYRCFLLDTLEALGELPVDAIVAAAEPDELEAISAALSDSACAADLTVQSGAVLGDRIANALRYAFARGHRAAVVIGTDAPDLPVAFITRAVELTADHDLVLGPCTDGGYYLIGLRAVIPSLFRGIKWSSDGVLSSTLQRAKELGLAVALLDPWEDVDTPSDLERLRQRVTAKALAGEPIPCPRTWDCLCDMPTGEVG